MYLTYSERVAPGVCVPNIKIAQIITESESNYFLVSISKERLKQILREFLSITCEMALIFIWLHTLFVFLFV